MSYFDHYNLKSLAHLDLLAKQVVEGFIIGLHKSPYHGFSVEFAEHRHYNPGQSIKNIDWKVYARTNKLYVKRYEEETNLRCQILIDSSSSMFYPNFEVGGGQELNKFSFSALGAAALMNILRKQRDAYGLSLYGEDVFHHYRPKSSTAQYNLVMTKLEQQIQNPVQNRRTQTAAALHEIAERIHKRSMVIIFTDLFDNADEEEELFSALQHLKFAKHEVLLFHVLDKKKEVELEFENRPYEFTDLESGQKIKLQPAAVKEQYTERINEYFKSIESKCLQFKIDYMRADISEGYNNILRAMLIKRSKMRA